MWLDHQPEPLIVARCAGSQTGQFKMFVLRSRRSNSCARRTRVTSYHLMQPSKLLYTLQWPLHEAHIRTAKDPDLLWFLEYLLLACLPSPIFAWSTVSSSGRSVSCNTSLGHPLHAKLVFSFLWQLPSPSKYRADMEQNHRGTQPSFLDEYLKDQKWYHKLVLYYRFPWTLRHAWCTDQFQERQDALHSLLLPPRERSIHFLWPCLLIWTA